MRIQPVIGEVLSALRRRRRRELARMSGFGRDLFCDLRQRRRGGGRRAKNQRDNPVWWVHAGVLS